MGTKFAEVIYETGSKSVVSYENVDELKKGLKDQHDRALTGAPGGPDGANWPAERVKTVLLYGDVHPSDLYGGVTVPTDVMKNALPAIVEGSTSAGEVNVWEVISKLRGLLSPLTNDANAGPHESMYVMKETSTLPLDFLDAKDGGK